MRKRHRDAGAGKGTLLLGKVLYCLSPRGVETEPNNSHLTSIF